jgi:sulfide:quinone oxidoreductase
MRSVVIAGAGFGGIAAATSLRRQFSPEQLRIVLVDRRDDFVMGLRKSWAALGIDSLDAGRRSLRDIAGIELRLGEITAVDAARRSIEVDGEELAGDALVLALGARHVVDALPGLAEHGINIWDRNEVQRAQQALAGLRRERLLIGIFGAPYSCPPAPFELALLARDRLPSGVAICVFSPAPLALPLVGPTESGKLERMLDERGIDFMRRRQPTEVQANSVSFAEGSRAEFDVLLAVPPHRSPQVLVEAGLTDESGWLKPDRHTLEMSQPDVYAVGDCIAIPLAGNLAVPKAGIMAEAQGIVAAERIAARLRGEEPTATFDGEGVCFIETGAGEAAKAGGSFLLEPPMVRISEPSAATMDEKREFERSRLERWFGR